MKNKKFEKIIFLIGLAGLADTLYLTFKHYLGGPIPCTISGCETVLNSQYSEIFGIPLALLGAIYYLSVLIVSIILFFKNNIRFVNILFVLSVVGFLTSTYLVYLQLFVINAICQFCMLSAILNTALLAPVILYRNKLK